MDNNSVKIEELKNLLASLMSRPDANNYLEEQHLLVEAVGMLRHTEFDQKRLVDVDGVLVSILDVERYKEIAQRISQISIDSSRNM